jgi:hypothetical protein
MARRLNLHKQAEYIDADFLRLHTFPLHSDGGPYISETFDSRFVLLSELSTKIGGRGNAGLMESEENIKPFPTLPTVLGNHQRTVITTFPPHDDGYGLILTFLSGAQ